MKLNELISTTAINHLIRLCMYELELDELPSIEFIDHWFVGTDDQRAFGIYDNNSIRIAIRGRHTIDSLRTLAHELVHWKQRSANMALDGETGSEIENQANALAGVIMRKFGKQYPEYFLNTIP